MSKPLLLITKLMEEIKLKPMATLEKKIFVTGEIFALSGLHIGGSNTSIEIGGVDTGVIRNPINNEPYIPGSSLKGKMRSLLEQSAGVFSYMNNQIKNGAYVEDKKHPLVKLFGATSSKHQVSIPSKIIVRDCPLMDHNNTLRDNKYTDLPFTEVKTEVAIDRITAKASPRQIERVPAGASFSFEVILNVWQFEKKEDNLDETEMIEILWNGMRLLEDDYLGGKGSRGSGKIKFNITKIKERNQDFYLSASPQTEKTFQESQHEIPKELTYAPQTP